MEETFLEMIGSFGKGILLGMAIAVVIGLAIYIEYNKGDD